MYDRSQENIVNDKHMRGKQGRIVKEQGVYSELQQGRDLEYFGVEFTKDVFG